MNIVSVFQEQLFRNCRRPAAMKLQNNRRPLAETSKWRLQISLKNDTGAAPDSGGGIKFGTHSSLEIQRFFSCKNVSAFALKQKQNIRPEQHSKACRGFLCKKITFLEIPQCLRWTFCSFSSKAWTVLHPIFGLLVEGTAIFAISSFSPEPVRLLLGAASVGRPQFD